MAEENKFNFSEEEKKLQHDKDQVVEEKKEAVRQDAKGLFKSIRTFLSELLDFREDTDRDATITAIKGDIPFKGATAWILICSIFVASIGLNANSTAVVIGAMLISPLMGPILGIGMSIAINDIITLRKSLINLATMIVLSLLTAFLFFWLFPLKCGNIGALRQNTARYKRCTHSFLWWFSINNCANKKRDNSFCNIWCSYSHSVNASALYGWLWSCPR